MVKEKEFEKLTDKEQAKYGLAILILMFPSLFIAAFAAIPIFALRVGLQIIMLLFQFVLIKNLMDDYYSL